MNELIKRLNCETNWNRQILRCWSTCVYRRISEAAHIPGAINKCVYEVAFKDRMLGIAPDHTHVVVVYGQDSETYEARIAADKLARAGYTQVYEYRDGLAGWQAAEHSGREERNAASASLRSRTGLTPSI